MSGVVTEPNRTARRRLRRYAPFVVGTALTVLCGIFIVRILIDDWAQVSDSIAHASPAWLAAALGFGALGMVVIAYTWADAVAVMGGSVRRCQSIAWYFVGDVAKYLPGSIWAAVGRGEIARRRGVPAAQAYPSVALSLIAVYTASVLTVGILLPFGLVGSSDLGSSLFLLFLVPLGIGALNPRVLGWLLGHARRVTKRSLEIRIPAWHESIILVVRYIPAWLAIGASTWCLTRALPGVHAPMLRIFVATMLSWTAGFVTPTPGGAGVREAVFVAISGLAAGPAVTVAVTSRVIFVLVDVLGALAGLPVTGRRAQPVDSVDLSGLGPTQVPVDEKG